MSRTEFVCYRCHAKVANIRPGPPRSLTPAPHVQIEVKDDHRILLKCPCSAVNQYTWRTKAEQPIPTATLATQNSNGD